MAPKHAIWKNIKRISSRSVTDFSYGANIHRNKCILPETSSHYKHLEYGRCLVKCSYCAGILLFQAINNYQEKLSVCFTLWCNVGSSFPVKHIFIMQKQTLTFKCNQVQMRVFCRETVTNVNSFSWVFSNKCLPGELMIEDELCKRIRRGIPAGRWDDTQLQPAASTRRLQMNINSKRCTQPILLESPNHLLFYNSEE